MAYVSIFITGREPQRFELKDVNVFGRASTCDVWVEDPNVSRQHCTLQRDDQKWMLLDLDSTNGTWLDAARVRRYAIRDGETFYIGDARIVFHVDKYVDNRPTDPNEASQFALMVPPKADENEQTMQGLQVKRKLPTPRATVVKADWSEAVRAQGAAASIAFRRPPARPIPRVDRSGWRVGALVARLRGQK